MNGKSKASPLHTVSLWCVSSNTSPVIATEQHASQWRHVKGISCSALVFVTALLTGCSESLMRGGSLLAGSNLSGSGIISAPLPEPSAPPLAPSAPEPESEPSPPPSAPAPPPSAPTPPPPEPEPVPPPPEPEPLPPPPEPIPPPPEPLPPPPVPPVTQCSSGLAAQDLSGQCRASPPTPGALEAVVGTSTAGVTLASLTVSQPASRVLVVSWHPFGTNTSGYLVYYGQTANSANALVSDLPTNSGVINPAAPAVTYDSVRDLGLFVGDTVCFRIHAYNSARTVTAEVFLGCSAI